jgi:cellulose synthase/poly-beta-1,6-N-acetylglucosamine synthase-like glycosyltransferase
VTAAEATWRDGRPAGQPSPPPPSSLPIGEALVAYDLLTRERLDRALELQKLWNMRLGEVLMAKGWVRAVDFYALLADQQNLPFIDLMRMPPEDDLLDPEMVDIYVAEQVMPWRHVDGHVVWATPDPDHARAWIARTRPGERAVLAVTSKFDILWALQQRFNERFTDRAVHELYDQDPVNSARQVITGPQLIVLYLMLTAFLFGLWQAPVFTLLVVNVIMTGVFLGTFVFKLALTLIGGSVPKLDRQVTDEEVAALTDDDLPSYTILVPMFREPEVLPILAGAIRRLDYPLAKLDIKLVLEEGDDATIDAAKKLGLESIFEIVRVPPSQPQTKPKACNYALSFARGDYLVIYDAEDKPEPDQLKKAVVGFAKAPANTACLQARLNYFNANENWLTRLFTIDYSLWFDFMLPALDYLKMPIPLGGTSNHFRTDVLRELRAWDPYNVTEDADLGVRLTQKGYRVGVINSTTFEEANVRAGNWVRQRSRWLKGYMQTYLVHMRRPLKLFMSLGPRAFVGFQFFIGGNIVAALGAPVFWIIYGYWLITQSAALEPYFPGILLYLNLFNLVIGNVAFTYLAVVAPLKRGLYNLIPYGLSVFAYWVLMSIAAYKGLWQLVTRPFYWEKTQHGLSSMTHHEIAAANRGSDPS